jgi:hypothetical protein
VWLDKALDVVVGLVLAVAATTRRPVAPIPLALLIPTSPEGASS